MKSIIGSVPYLNARPLIGWFDTPAGSEQAELVLDMPSRLAEMLEARSISVGMLSSFEAFRRPDTLIVPGVAIASRGAVKSVRLFSRVPFQRIDCLALDASSLTSNNLARILLAEQWSIAPYCEPSPPDLAHMLDRCDAAILIGDPGMSAQAEGLRVLDLGEAWKELTGLPFVWAVWLANEEQLLPVLSETLIFAKEYGQERIEAIAEREASRLGWPPFVCLDYLKNVMDYELGPEHLEGLLAFQQKCLKHGLLETALPIRLVDRAPVG